MVFQPIVFVHAYALLGNSPQRFGTDLQLYLATVNAFFERQAATGGRHVTLTGIAASDAKRRLSEDFGAVLSALFMVDAYGVAWETIAQIPMNSKLSKKRPDFEGFDSSGNRYLFEAKGTTSLSGVENALHKAIEQVKKYPEASTSKLAIVSYLAADDRLFPSQTFVVDPPALPDAVPPSREVAILLHGEKLFEFAGMPETAAAYVRALAKVLKSKADAISPPTAQLQALRNSYSNEYKKLAIDSRTDGNRKYVGRVLAASAGDKRLYAGVAEDTLQKLLEVVPTAPLGQSGQESRNNSRNEFSDGSILLVD